MKLNNTYYILRHGEALSNKNNFFSCWPEKSYNPLTAGGRKQAESSLQKLKNKRIDLIFSSDILRAKQTAGIASNLAGIRPKFDKRLREYNLGVLNGKPAEEFRKHFPTEKIEMRFGKKPKGGETYREIIKRVYSFFKGINKKYSSKNILIVSHEAPLILLEAKLRGIPQKQIFKKYPKEKRIKTGELRQLRI